MTSLHDEIHRYTASEIFVCFLPVFLRMFLCVFLPVLFKLCRRSSSLPEFTRQYVVRWTLEMKYICVYEIYLRL